MTKRILVVEDQEDLRAILRPSNAGDKAAADRTDHIHEYNRYSCGFTFQGNPCSCGKQ